MSTPTIDIRKVAEIDSDFNMSAEPQVFGPFTISGIPSPTSENPKATRLAHFLLREVGEKGHSRYMSQSLRGMAVKEGDDGKKTLSMEGANLADSHLTASCLFEVTVDSDNTVITEKPCTPEFVQSLPHRIAARLYKKARDLSGMNEDEETVEFLEKRIASDTKRLELLKTAGTVGK